MKDKYNYYKASVVIPNYNQGRFLPRSIGSILKQKYDPNSIEIIVVDDCSTDNSKELLAEYLETLEEKDRSRISTIFSNKNGGTAATRNKGVKAAKHGAICFLDADDEYHPDKIIKSINDLTLYPEIGCVYTDYIEIYPDGNNKVTFKPPYNKQVLFQNCIVSTNSIVKSEVFNVVGYFDESIRGCEDYDMWLRISARYSIRHIAEPLFTYYHHGENKSDTSDMNKWQQEERIIRERAARGEYYVAN